MRTNLHALYYICIINFVSNIRFAHATTKCCTINRGQHTILIRLPDIRVIYYIKWRKKIAEKNWCCRFFEMFLWVILIHENSAAALFVYAIIYTMCVCVCVFVAFACMLISFLLRLHTFTVFALFHVVLPLSIFCCC